VAAEGLVVLFRQNGNQLLAGERGLGCPEEAGSMGIGRLDGARQVRQQAGVRGVVEDILVVGTLCLQTLAQGRALFVLPGQIGVGLLKRLQCVGQAKQGLIEWTLLPEQQTRLLPQRFQVLLCSLEFVTEQVSLH